MASITIEESYGLMCAVAATLALGLLVAVVVAIIHHKNHALAKGALNETRDILDEVQKARAILAIDFDQAKGSRDRWRQRYEDLKAKWDAVYQVVNPSDKEE